MFLVGVDAQDSGTILPCSWYCTPWNECVDGIQTRDCTVQDNGGDCEIPESERACGYSENSFCTDSDGGKNYYVRGYASTALSDGPIEDLEDECALFDTDDRGGSFSGVDECAGERCGITEWLCRGDILTVDYNADCSDGCVDGACIRDGEVEESSYSLVESCSDSDGGLNVFERGDVTAKYLRGELAGQTKTFSEGCYFDTHINEMYCTEDGGDLILKTERIECDNGCRNGACVGEGGDVVEEDGLIEEEFSIVDGVIEEAPRVVPVPVVPPYGEDYDRCVDLCVDYAVPNECGGERSGECAELMEGGCELSCQSCDGLTVAYNSRNRCVEICVEVVLPTECGGELGGECAEFVSETCEVKCNLCAREIFGSCDSGCLSGDTCYPISYRKSVEYCSDGGEFVSQLGSGGSCNNNFECSSNVCVDGKCLSSSFIKKILNWFARLFGGSDKQLSPSFSPSV